jgi:hypothetical protein
MPRTLSRIVHSLIAGGVIALAAAVPALAATAPSVSTGPVTAVGPTTATVSGTVNPNGTATNWHVEYGTSTGYGSSTSSTSAGAGTTSTGVSANLSGLKAGTTYHYRFVAVSTAGTSRGADGILQTSSTPAAATGSASSIGSTTATLNGTVNPNGRSTTWYFEYGTSTSYGTKTPVKDAGAGTSATTVSVTVTGLTTGRVYHFRLVASSDAGTSRGTDQTFLPTAVPTVVTKAASSIRDTTTQLNGTVNPNGLATTSYFEYGTSTAYGTKTTVKSAGSGRSTRNESAGIAGLAGATTYHYRFVATSTAGTTAGADQTFTTLGRASVQTGGATSIGEQTATLTGSVTPNGHSASWYFEWGTGTSYGTRLATKSAGSGTTVVVVSAPISGLSGGTTYHFRLVATNSAGTSTGADVAFTTAGAAVTLAATSSRVIFGHPVRLAGIVGTKLPNQRVTVFAKRFDAGSFTAVTTVLTGVGGSWTLTVRPKIGTTYKALFNSNGSPAVTIAVRPAITVHAVRKTAGHFSTHVAGAHSFAGRIVQLQRRLANGGWRTIARRALNRHSATVFAPRLARGRWTLRVAMSVNQAGAGYLAGFSGSIGYKRR